MKDSKTVKDERHVLRGGKIRWVAFLASVGFLLLGVAMIVGSLMDLSEDIGGGGAAVGAYCAAIGLVGVLRAPRVRLELQGPVLTSCQILWTRRLAFTDTERPVLSVRRTWNGLGHCPVVQYAGTQRRVGDTVFIGRKERERLEQFVELVNGYTPD